MSVPLILICGRSQWPRGLRRRSAAARLLGLWVRTPSGAWMFVCCECCVLSGRGLCGELNTRPEESYLRWCVVVCDLETSRMRPWPTGRGGGVPVAPKKIPICEIALCIVDVNKLQSPSNATITYFKIFFCLQYAMYFGPNGKSSDLYRVSHSLPNPAFFSIILASMKILQGNLNRSTFVV